MKFNLFRRLLVLVFTVSFISVGVPLIASAEPSQSTAIQQKLAELEAFSGGRLGLSALNTGNNMHIDYRAQERFPFCSTGKIMVVAAILKQSEHDPEILQKQITYGQQDIDKSGYAPITQHHIDDGMSISALCQAAMEYSDNTAMNMLMNQLGGPKAVTAYARSIHDNTFRSDRFEPELNTAIPNDSRDTTTPSAMATSLKQLALGNDLALLQRKQLLTWMKHNTTGDDRVRAGLPKGWRVADKTGTGDYGTTNDIAVIWPPHCAPIILAIYFTQRQKDAAINNAVIATATRIVVKTLASADHCIKEDKNY